MYINSPGNLPTSITARVPSGTKKTLRFRVAYTTAREAQNHFQDMQKRFHYKRMRRGSIRIKGRTRRLYVIYADN